jgi:hypothetical protein
VGRQEEGMENVIKVEEGVYATKIRAKFKKGAQEC